jgi:ribosomal protein S11
MYEMKQLSQRKVTQQEAAAYFDAVFNNTNLSMAEQDESIIQFYRNAAMPNQTNSSKTEPNGRAMSKVMTMFNGHGRGRTQFSQRYRVWFTVLSQNFVIMNVEP